MSFIRYVTEDNIDRFVEILYSSVRGKIILDLQKNRLELQQYGTCIYEYEYMDQRVDEFLLSLFPFIHSDYLLEYDLSVQNEIMTLKDLKKIIEDLEELYDLDDIIVCDFNDEFSAYSFLNKKDHELFSGRINQRKRIIRSDMYIDTLFFCLKNTY